MIRFGRTRPVAQLALGVALLLCSASERAAAAAYDMGPPGYPGSRSSAYQHYDYFQPVGVKAMVELKALDKDGNPIDGARGHLTLEERPYGVRIYGMISGLTKGLHGFHVHEKGDLSKGCDSAGPHFNPDLVNHGGPKDHMRHLGDLGNIEAGEDGVSQIDGFDYYLTLTGVRGAIGRAIVVHEKQDDLGRGGTEESAKTGSSGGRVACGIIGYT